MHVLTHSRSSVHSFMLISVSVRRALKCCTDPYYFSTILPACLRACVPACVPAWQVVTFWEGEIVDNRNNYFITAQWEAT